jgi:hypothetical protein
MTFDEWKKIAKGLRAVYTSDRFLPDGDSVRIWFSLLKDLPYEQVSIAAQKYMETEHFPPTPADLRAAVTPPPAEWSDAWAQVIGAVRKYGSWDVKKAEESFDDLTARVVKNLGGFRRICELEYDEMDVLRANFRDIYSRQAKAEAESNQMSPQLREMVSQMLEGMGTKQLEGGD